MSDPHIKQPCCLLAGLPDSGQPESFEKLMSLVPFTAKPDDLASRGKGAQPAFLDFSLVLKRDIFRLNSHVAV